MSKSPHNYQDLTLAVAAHHLPIECHILSEVACELGADVSLRMQIIGESHIVTLLRRGQPSFQEVLACVDVDPLLCEHHLEVGKKKKHHWQWNQLSYEVALEIVPVQAVLVMPGYIGNLLYQFPETHGVIPVTQLVWKVESNKVRWTTLHLYPYEDGVTSVISRSEVQLAV